MATDADTGAQRTTTGAWNAGPVGARATDYRSWKFLAWMGPVFLAAFTCLWGILAGNIPPFSPNADPQAVWQHYHDQRLPILIGMSVCLTLTACYMAWSVAVSRVMERIEGPAGVWSKIEIMGGTITCAPIMTACAMWLAAAHEIDYITPGVAHLLYWMGWLLIDLAYMVTSFQIAGAAIVFMKDRRPKKLVPDVVSWWGWVTVASFFVVNAIPFVTTGPLAFNGAISFWFAFFTWFFWIPSMSYFVIKAVDRIKVEDAAGLAG
ncbi:hypothetical protein ACTXG6_11785 [Pseudonocardia sp. Cha107L01]|uniref:hypothetical protein n=1 Tax=Pseudonocardia sp. Cha107L01 TaxID=3457576 RepID=UPI00403E8BCD